MIMVKKNNVNFNPIISKLQKVQLKFLIDVYGNTAIKDQVKISELNSDFSNLIFVNCLKLSKTYSISVFFKDGLKLYVFKNLKLKSTFLLEKNF